MARVAFFALLSATLIALAAASKRPAKCAYGGTICNTLVPEFPGCCKPKTGPSFQTGQCDCKSCHLGTFQPGKCNCICPLIFKPVCCNVNGKEETKGNSCQCGCANGKVVREGECKASGSCICTKEFENTCCKRKKDGKLFQASNKCVCECEGSIIGSGKCPAKTCADVKCANCVDTIWGPKCSAVTPAPPKITCANVLCGPGTTCCIETKNGPKCVKKDDKRCRRPDITIPPPPPATCAATLCVVGTCCIETPSGAKCIKKDDKRCPKPPVTKPPPGCPCPKNLNPTCCKSNGLLFTAANRCLCKCRGTIIGPGKCPKVTCANVRCAGPCIDTINGPKCKNPPKSSCRSVKCGGNRPCCIETKRGPKCVRGQHKKCPTRITCKTVKCTRKHPCCIETRNFPKCVRNTHPRCRRRD